MGLDYGPHLRTEPLRHKPLKKIQPNRVAGYGNALANLAIVGEGPGKNENIEKIPFVGVSGKLLRRIITDLGFDPIHCWLTNIWKYQPPKNEYARASETNGISEAQAVKDLQEELRQVNPNCVLMLGGNVLKALTGYDGITEYRGSLLYTDIGFKSIATFHPSGLLQSGHSLAYNRRAFRSDVAKAFIEAGSPKFSPPFRNIQIAKSFYDLYRWVRENREYSDFLTLDIESDQCVPICIGLCFRPQDAMIVPLLPEIRGKRLTDMSIEDIAACHRLINKLTSDPSIKLSGQNFKFDQEKLESFFGWEFNNVHYDTELMAHTVSPEEPKRLRYLVSIHTKEPYYKNEGREFNILKDNPQKLYVYCGKDVCTQSEVTTALDRQLKAYDLSEFYDTYVRDLYGHYYTINKTGIDINLAKKEELRQQYLEQIVEKEQEISDLVAKVTDGKVTDFNVKSPKQVKLVLFDVLKLTRRPSTDEETLYDILIRDPKVAGNPDISHLIYLMLDLRRLRDVLSRYVEFDLDFDFLVKTNYNQAGTKNGRTSTNKLDSPVRPFPIGLALQIITKHGKTGKKVREMFVPPPGWSFVEVDLAQAEARVVAVLSEDWELLDKLKDPNFDMHIFTASLAFLIDESEIGKKSDKRQIGKTVRHAGNYGMEWYRLIKTVETDSMKYGMRIILPKPQAQECLHNFHQFSPNIKEVFHYGVEICLKDDGYLITPQGRRRTFYGVEVDRDQARERGKEDYRINHELMKEAFSTIPQATVSDHIKLTMRDLPDNYTKPYKTHVEAHDGILYSVPTDDVAEFGRTVKGLMERPINFKKCSLSRDYDLFIPADVSVSHTNWREMMEIEV